MEKKYQVFISSTFTDLKEERVEIMEALINLGHIPVGMELFNAADDTQWGVIKRRIEESDYYVLLLSDRYGSIDADGIGFTEKEYNYAIEINKPVISFVREQKTIDLLPFEFRESDNRKKLEEFKKKVATRLYKPWETKHDLSKKFFLAFAELIREKPQAGWVRFDSIEQENKNQFNQLFSDNQKLTEENRRLTINFSNVDKELRELKSIKSKAKEIVEILPKKGFSFGEYKFNGIELVGLFGGFVAIEGPLNEIVTSIMKFLVVQTQDEHSWNNDNKDSIKYIVGSFASLGLIEIKSETHILHDEDSHKGDFRKRDEIRTIEFVKPTQLLSEVYSKIESLNIGGILTVQAKSEHLKKKKRLEELSNFKDDAYWGKDDEDYKKRKKGKIESILTEFISLASWDTEQKKKEFYDLDFLEDNAALGTLFSKANEVLKEIEEKALPNIVYK
jgi:hypothetical protein